MIFQGVRLPDEIRIAQEKGELVVFAGAGVSRGSPSDLPSYGELVDEIGGRLGAKIPEDLNPDEVLGRWFKEGRPVNEEAARILKRPSSSPTVLHKSIIRLFGEADRVKIVTTNFDLHFTTSAQEVFPDDAVPTYSAPAIPLGDEIEGIVHVHGSADRPQKMVFTDADFAQAYLNRGWAKDFLLSLFSRYSVLFVGYSLNDMVVSYLARGMRGADSRWALVPGSLDTAERERWDHMGISTLTYPVGGTKETRHQALTTFFADWAQHCSETVLDHAPRIKALASKLPPERDEDSEYIDYCIKQEPLARDFFAHLKQPAWVGWLNERGYLKPIFETDKKYRRDLTPSQVHMARWLCGYVRENYAEWFLDLIQKNNNHINPALADLLSHHLWSTKPGKTVPLFTTWVSLLLAQGESVLNTYTWGYIFKECREDKTTGMALELFEMLTRPKLRLRRFWDLSLFDQDKDRKKTGGRKVDHEIEWLSETDLHSVEDGWNQCLKPRMKTLAEQLMALITRQLTAAHTLLRGVGKANDAYDSLSWGRSSIAPHQQNDRPLHGTPSLLIDAARDILNLWIREAPERADAQMQIWWNYQIPIFRRLVIYGKSRDGRLSANAKLRWLLSHDLIFTLGLKKEVFDLLAVAYPEAGVSVRRRILARIRKGVVRDRAEKLDPQTIAYEQFNVLTWLDSHAPNCELIKRALSEITKRNPDFKVREHPEFDHWHGEAGFVDPKEGFDFDRILSEPPDGYLDSLLGAKEESFRKDRWSYLSNLGVLFGRDREWGARFMTALARREIFEIDLWQGVFSAWREVLKGQEDWCWMLDVCESLPHEAAVSGGIAYAIDHGFWEKETEVSDEMVERAEKLMRTAWKLCRDDPEKMETANRDWYTNAINHRGGWIGQFWIEHLNYLRKKAGKRWRRIPVAYRRMITQALDGDGAVRSYARIALVPYVAYLFAWDKAFAREKLLGLFDWKQDPVVAQQSWSVLLDYSRGNNIEWNLKLLDYLREFVVQITPMLRDAAEEEGQFDSTTLSHLGQHLASIAMRAMDDPVASGFFSDFLPILPDGVREGMAQGMGHHFEHMSDEEQLAIWDRWFKRYLEDRIVGVPVSLSPDESKTITYWASKLKGIFVPMTALIRKMPLKEAMAYSIITNLVEEKLADKFPEEACWFCCKVLEADEHPGWDGELKGIYAIFAERIPDSLAFKKFKEILYQRGWRGSDD
jgi:hypothetical protein